jgi:hypothetical protein
VHDRCSPGSCRSILCIDFILVGTHYIAHRKTLAAKATNDSFLELAFINRVANEVYEWLGHFVICRGCCLFLWRITSGNLNLQCEMAILRIGRIHLLHANSFLGLEGRKTNLVLKHNFFAIPIFCALVSLHSCWAQQVESEILIWSCWHYHRASIVDATINLLQRQYLGVNFGRTSRFLGRFL